jgi:hypothetical protein
MSAPSTGWTSARQRRSDTVRRLAGVVVAAALALTACSSGGSGDDDADSTFTAPAGSLGAKYLAIANPANEKLDNAIDALEDDDHKDLKASAKDLTAAAAVERAFDRSLLAITWPPAIEATAKSMVAANEARADIDMQAAGSMSLAQLAGYEQDLDVGNGVVERWVTMIRTQLDLPPPDTS